MSDVIRVLRVIEYVGPREWVEMSLDKRQVKGTLRFDGTKDRQINEAIIGEYPEILEQEGCEVEDE